MNAHVDPRTFESAAGEARRAMVAHLRTCAACRADAAAHDPSILFSLLAEAPIPPHVLDEVSRSVSRQAGSDRFSIGGLFALAPSMPLRAAAAAVAAVALLSAYLTLRPGPPPGMSARAVPERPAVATPRADVEVEPQAAVSQVVDFTVGDTQVVMVYNRSLDL